MYLRFKGREFVNPGAGMRAYFSSEGIILDGFYRMRWRNDLMFGARGRGAYADGGQFIPSTRQRRDAQLGRRAGSAGGGCSGSE